MSAYRCDYPKCLERGCDKSCNAALPPEDKAMRPTQSLLQGMPYVNAASTDLRATFARIRSAQAPASAKNVTTIKQRKTAK